MPGGGGECQGEMRSLVLCLLGTRRQPNAVAYVSLEFRTVRSSSTMWIVAEATGIEKTIQEEELIRRVTGEWRNAFIYDMGRGRSSWKGLKGAPRDKGEIPDRLCQ